MDYGRPTLADALAAQYVAGTLRGGARRRFEALLPGHPALRDALQDWQARLLPLTAVIEPVAPPARVWRGVQSRLWPESATGAAASAAPMRWWQALALWRGFSAFATVAALGLAVLLAMPPQALPPVIVVLQGTGADATPSFVASISGDGRALVARPVQTVSLQSDRVFELWAVPTDGVPRSLGLVSSSSATVLARERLPVGLLRGGFAALAVSVEPPGGSPTGAPTGPVVYAGKLVL